MNDDVEGNTKNTKGETALRILQVIEEKPNVTREELTEIVGLSMWGIEWNLAQLKAERFYRTCWCD